MKGKTLIEIDNKYYYVSWKYNTHINDERTLMVQMKKIVIRRRKRIFPSYKHKFIKNGLISASDFIQTINKHVESFVCKLDCTYLSKHTINVYMNIDKRRK